MLTSLHASESSGGSLLIARINATADTTSRLLQEDEDDAAEACSSVSVVVEGDEDDDEDAEEEDGKEAVSNAIKVLASAETLQRFASIPSASSLHRAVPRLLSRSEDADDAIARILREKTSRQTSRMEFDSSTEAADGTHALERCRGSDECVYGMKKEK